MSNLLVSGVQQSNSIIYYVYVYMCVYIYSFSESLPFKLLQDIKYSSLCYIVNPCWLFILYIIMCIC